MRIQLVAAVALLVCTQACANTSEPAESGPDAGIGEPSPPPTPPGSQCGTNQHACNGSCVATQANEPSVGCALGCGEPCPAPADGAATCTEAGSCSISCSPGYAAINGECVLFSCFEVDYTCGSFVDE